MTRPDLPSGTVTFLFTDVQGSTKLLHALGADGYAAALAEHRRLLREAFARHGGVEVDTQGDAFFVAFPTAPGALAAAIDATAALRDGPIRVRIGLHTGAPLVTDEGYIGPDVHRGARIAAAGHGAQILVSAATAQLVDGTALRDLGLHRPRICRPPSGSTSSGSRTTHPSRPCTRPTCRCRPARSSAATPSWRRSVRCWPATTCAFSPSPVPVAPARRGSRSKRRPMPPTNSPEACGGCRSHHCVTRLSCCRVRPRRSAPPASWPSTSATPACSCSSTTSSTSSRPPPA